MRTPSLSALRAFEAAARFGSLKEGASELNITPSAISHQIRRLEETLDTELFERTKTGLVLTETGKYYLKPVQTALAMLEQATHSICISKDVETLRISTLSTLSTLWLIPQLKEFHQLFPEIRVNLLDDSDLSDFKKAEVDAAIRYDFYGKSEWPDLASDPLLEEYVMPVCSPKFLQQHPEIIDMEKLLNSRLLVNHRHPNEWANWFEAVGISIPAHEIESNIVLDTSNMTLTAATNNLGVALGRTPFIDTFLEKNLLVRVTDCIQFRGMRHFLVSPEQSHNDENFRRFRDWILSTTQSMNTQYRKTKGKIFA